MFSSMEGIIEALKSGNIVAWGIVIVLVVLALKLLQAAGKGFFILVVAAGIGAVLYHFFPGAVAPLVDFVQGGWLGDER